MEEWKSGVVFLVLRHDRIGRFFFPRGASASQVANGMVGSYAECRMRNVGRVDRQMWECGNAGMGATSQNTHHLCTSSMYINIHR